MKKVKNLVLFGVLTLCLVPQKVSKSDFKALTLPSLSKKEESCLVEAVYYESRSESTRGQLAVALTVLNRTKSQQFPNTVCKVVKQSKKKGVYQFSYLADKKVLAKPKEPKAWKKAQSVAKNAVFLHTQGLDFTKGADHYHTTAIRPKWSKSPKMKKIKVIENHVFYKSRSQNVNK